MGEPTAKSSGLLADDIEGEGAALTAAAVARTATTGAAVDSAPELSAAPLSDPTAPAALLSSAIAPCYARARVCVCTYIYIYIYNTDGCVYLCACFAGGRGCRGLRPQTVVSVHKYASSSRVMTARVR